MTMGTYGHYVSIGEAHTMGTIPTHVGTQPNAAKVFPTMVPQGRFACFLSIKMRGVLPIHFCLLLIVLPLLQGVLNGIQQIFTFGGMMKDCVVVALCELINTKMLITHVLVAYKLKKH
jgi:hypothetical protein